MFQTVRRLFSARQFILLVTMFAASLAASILWSRLRYSIRPPSGPSLECPTRIEVDNAESGSEITVPFEIGNRGGSRLILHAISATCACLGFEEESSVQPGRLEAITLEPGERRRFVMRITVRGPGGSRMTNTIRFRTNDPDRSEASLTVDVAHVLGGIVATPSPLSFGSIRARQRHARLIEIRDASRPTRTIERVECTGCDASVTVIPADISSPQKSNDDYKVIARLRVEVNPSSEGPHDGLIRLHLSDGRPPDVIAFNYHATNEVEVVPAAVFLPRRSTDGPQYAMRVFWALLTSVWVDQVYKRHLEEVEAGPTHESEVPFTMDERWAFSSKEMGRQHFRPRSDILVVPACSRTG